MTTLIEAYEAVVAFFNAGGNVLYAIFVALVLMWVLISERLWYLNWGYHRDEREGLEHWRARNDKTSWAADQVRARLVSMMKQKLNHSLPMVATLVALCPLLGLLGTVTGMVEVFDVMAISGNGNPRAMAGGVSASTIPTMAGMVAALSGLYFSVRLTRTAEKLRRRFADELKSM